MNTERPDLILEQRELGIAMLGYGLPVKSHFSDPRHRKIHGRELPFLKIGGLLRFDEEVLNEFDKRHAVNPRQIVVNL